MKKILLLATVLFFSVVSVAQDGLSTNTLGEQTLSYALEEADAFFKERGYPTIRPDQFLLVSNYELQKLWHGTRSVRAITELNGHLRITVYLDADMDFREPRNIETVIHELVHVYQFQQYIINNEEYCGRTSEDEAYGIQVEWRVEQGDNLMEIAEYIMSIQAHLDETYNGCELIRAEDK